MSSSRRHGSLQEKQTLRRKLRKRIKKLEVAAVATTSELLYEMVKRRGEIKFMAKVLLFQCKDELAVRQILTPMKIKVISVPKEKMHLTLGELESNLWDEGIFGGEYPQESMLVMCDFTENQMNKLLLELRRKKVKIDYKAMMTPTNRDWDVLHMYFEMAREKAMYEQMKRDRQLKKS